MIVEMLLVPGGLTLLVLGGDPRVMGAVRLSLKLGMTPLVVGLTVVAFGTWAPELLSATLKGSGGIAMGNVIGPGTANSLGITAMISPLAIPPRMVRVDLWLVLAAALLLAPFLFRGISLKRPVGAAFLAGRAGDVRVLP